MPNALDQFYTKPEVASLCFDTIKHRGYDLWLEPSAGTGRFYNLLPDDKRKGIDLEPRHDEVEKQDFFDFTIEQGNNIAIGNPPFGYRAQGAIAFFNHAAKFCNTIAFIVSKPANLLALNLLSPATIIKPSKSSSTTIIG